MGPTVFNIFISDVGDEIRYTLMKFDNDTKLSEGVDTLESYPAGGPR